MKPVNKILRKLKSISKKSGFDIVRYISVPDLLSLHGIDIVLDIGGNDGGYASSIRSEGWKREIVSFEPQPKTFQRMEDRFTRDQHWKGLNIGLGDCDAQLDMNIYEMDVLSSFLRKVEDNPVVEVVQVPVHRMDGIFDEVVGGKKRPFVKIDTQGFEMKILEGFGNRAGDVIGWQLELSVEPLYENQPPMEEVISKMRSMGFDLWRIIPGLREPSTLRAMEYDGLFFKSGQTLSPV